MSRAPATTAMMAGRALVVPGFDQQDRRAEPALRAPARGETNRRSPSTSSTDAAFQAGHRVRRHALQRLADSEERPHGAGRDRPRHARGLGPPGVRALRLGPHRRRRARARPGRAPRALHQPRAGTASSSSQRRAAGRHPHPRRHKAPHRFHARHDAVSRSYLYQISRRRTAFAKPFVWWIREPLDVGAMRRRAAAFVGRQDFAAFSDDDPEEKSTVVVLERSRSSKPAR